MEVEDQQEQWELLGSWPAVCASCLASDLQQGQPVSTPQLSFESSGRVGLDQAPCDTEGLQVQEVMSGNLPSMTPVQRGGWRAPKGYPGA